MSVIIESVSELADILEKSSLIKKDSLPTFSSESLAAMYAMGYELYRNGKYEDALAFFKLLTLSNSFERKYLMGLAACYQMLKDYEKALECYSAAAIQNSTDPYVHWHAADCFFHSGNLIKAQEALESALVTAKQDNTHHALIPKLELIADAWSYLSNGGSNDRTN